MEKNTSKKIFSSTHKKLIIKDTGIYGNGVFASEDIKKGEIIHILSGTRMTLGELIKKVTSGKEFIDDPFQIGRMTYLDLDSLSRSFNHSCDPCGGIRKVSELFALRDIKEGEEITYDYSLTIAPTEWGMKCACNTKKCRKNLGDVLSVPESRLLEYEKMGALQNYMKFLLKDIKSFGYKMPTYEKNALEKLASLK